VPEWLTCWTRAGTEDPELVVMVTVTLPDLVVSAAEVAVRVTVGGVGAGEGAPYVTEEAVTAESVPQVALEQPAPERLQVTL